MPPTDEDFARLEGKLDTVVECLQGDLKSAKPGIVGRLDRLEVSERRRDWWAKAALGAGIAAAAGTAWQFLTGGKQP